ncbi:hypothetical protein Tco_1215258 [Tanacetum coccineum]
MAHRVDHSLVDTMETRFRDTERRMMTPPPRMVNMRHYNQAADDLAVQHIMRTQALKAGARVDTLEDTASTAKKRHQKNHKVNIQSHQRPKCNNPPPTVTEATTSGLIDQGVAAAMAEAEASRATEGDVRTYPRDVEENGVCI